MIDAYLVHECRDFIRNRVAQRREITMQLKANLGREQRFFEVGKRLSELHPFIDYIYDDIIHLYGRASDFYNACNISRQVFSKMQEANYDPTLETMYKILIGLRLSFLDAVILMENAGYTFTYKTSTQLVIIFCIINRIYLPEDVDTLLVESGENPLFSA